MNILFAASEVAPFAMTGGLADVAGSLPPALAGLGHDVRIIMPYYRDARQRTKRLVHRGSFSVPIGDWVEHGDILEGSLTRTVKVLFVQKDLYFDRPGLYQQAHADYADNAERFVFFSRAVLEYTRQTGFRPDIIHCNDWQTGLVPLYLRTAYRNVQELAKARTIFTVHNLGYQGRFWHWDMRLIGLGWEPFTPDGIEFWGGISFLKAGLVYADVITTVSRTYSREIQTPEYGFGLEGVLKKRAAVLFGVGNGIDYGVWDPARDPTLAKTYSAARPAGKEACRNALLEQTGLPPGPEPIIGMVTRLADQKGLDIVVEALDPIFSLGCRLVILGTGEERYHRMLSDAARRRPNLLRVLLQYDERVSRSVYAGCDLFLMPSRYEPCGLGQMHALRYGTVPVVRRTGGLADTVEEFDPRSGMGTGFLFTDYAPGALVECLRRAISVYHDKPAWRRLMRNGMTQDFSWDRSAREYLTIYRKAIATRATVRTAAGSRKHA